MTPEKLTKRIKELIEKTMGITPMVWVNRSKKRTSTVPRYVLSHFQRMAGMSFAEIAKHQGLNTYTSIYSQLQNLQDLMSQDETLQHQVAVIHTHLSNEKIQLQNYPVPVLLRGRNSSAALSHLRGQSIRNSKNITTT